MYDKQIRWANCLFDCPLLEFLQILANYMLPYNSSLIVVVQKFRNLYQKDKKPFYNEIGRKRNIHCLGFLVVVTQLLLILSFHISCNFVTFKPLFKVLQAEDVKFIEI